MRAFFRKMRKDLAGRRVPGLAEATRPAVVLETAEPPGRVAAS